MDETRQRQETGGEDAEERDSRQQQIDLLRAVGLQKIAEGGHLIAVHRKFFRAGEKNDGAVVMKGTQPAGHFDLPRLRSSSTAQRAVRTAQATGPPRPSPAR